MSDERETIQRNPESVAAWKRECAFLREQVEKLTKERDELKTVPMKYRRMQFNAELQDEVTQLQKQLLALAEQNEKMREALAECEQALERSSKRDIAQWHNWDFDGDDDGKAPEQLNDPVLQAQLKALAAIDALGDMK